MREHTLSATGGLTYAEMGQYQSAADPSNPVGTNDEAEAAKDANGQPISNSARDIWVTETALTTALNVGYMAEMLALFSIVVGVALLLTGIGFVILALAVCRGSTSREAVAPQTPGGRSGRDDFDRYVAERGIPREPYPAAFALWIAERTGGPVPRFEKVEREPPAPGSVPRKTARRPS
jgi:hypothetical protein